MRVLALALALGGCRSLVEPDAEIRRPPDRTIAGRVAELNGVPVTYNLLTLSNAAYSNPIRLMRSVPLSPSGSFSIELPRDFDGYFDLTVHYIGPFGARSENYYGHYDTGEPLNLPLDLVPMFGRIEVSEELGFGALAPGDLELSRRHSRPSTPFKFTQDLEVRFDGSGAIEDVIPRGPWEVWVRTGARGPLLSLEALVTADFVGGELETVLDLPALSLDVRLPRTWTAPIAVEFLMVSDDGQRVGQRVEIGEGTARVFAAGRWVRPGLSWPAGVATAYAFFAPTTAGGYVDTQQGGPVALLLPPSNLRLHVLDGGAPAGGTVIEVRELSNNADARADSDEEGHSVYFCENGTYEVTFTLAGRTLTRVVVVEDETELTVDFADAQSVPGD